MVERHSIPGSHSPVNALDLTGDLVTDAEITARHLLGGETDSALVAPVAEALAAFWRQNPKAYDRFMTVRR